MRASVRVFIKCSSVFYNANFVTPYLENRFILLSVSIVS